MRLLVLFLVLSGPAVAETGFWAYKDWRVNVEEVDTGEDVRRSCEASTGGDGLPRLTLRITNGDAGPPAAYPVPVFEEYAPRGYSTQIDPGDFILYEFDDGTGAEAELVTGREDGVYPFAHATPFPRDTLWMLQSMRRASTLTFYRSNETLPLQASGAPGREHVYTASLAGFTAAYLKTMESCGHAPGAVTD